MIESTCGDGLCKRPLREFAHRPHFAATNDEIIYTALRAARITPIVILTRHRRLFHISQFLFGAGLVC